MIAGLSTGLAKPNLKVATIISGSVAIANRDNYGSYIINGSGNTTVTLPLANENPYRKIFIKKIDSSGYYTFIERQGSDLINEYYYRYTLYQQNAGIEIQSLPTSGVFHWKTIYDTPENNWIAMCYSSVRDENETWVTSPTRYVYEGEFIANMWARLQAHHTSATDYTYGLYFDASAYALDANGSVDAWSHDGSPKYSYNSNQVMRWASSTGYGSVSRGYSCRFGVSTYRRATPGNHATDRSGRLILTRYAN